MWRLSIQRAIAAAAMAPRSPAAAAAAFCQRRQVSELARKYRSPFPMAGWARRFPLPKGVKHTQEWRRRLVKRKTSRRSFCPYTIKARRLYSKIRFEAQQRRLEMAARKEAGEAGEGAAAGSTQHFSRQSSGSYGRSSSWNSAPRMDDRSRYGMPSGRNELVVPESPAEGSSSTPAYCKPVVKKIDSWRAPWTKPFKKPRQEYQVGRPRPMSKAAAKAVKNDREAAKVKRRTNMQKRLVRGKIVNPKERMEYT